MRLLGWSKSACELESGKCRLGLEKYGNRDELCFRSNQLAELWWRQFREEGRIPERVPWQVPFLRTSQSDNHNTSLNGQLQENCQNSHGVAIAAPFVHFPV